MKKTLLSLAVIGCSMLSAGAFASDGSILINGQVTNVSCSITIDGKSGTAYEIVLPTVAQSALKKGDTAGAKLLAIHLSGCTAAGGSLPVGVRAVFEDTNVNPDTGNLINTTAPGGTSLGATNVEVQITNGDLLPINLMTNHNNMVEPIDVDGNSTMRYYVQYIAPSADAIAGKVTTSAVYSLDYQ